MKLAVLAYLAAAPTAFAQDVSVPSGIAMTLYDVIIEKDAARFRFLAPAIDPAGAGLTFTQVADDLQYLCDALVMPALAHNGWAAVDVVISLSAQEVVFGETAPDVMQFFQPFSIQGDACIWEDF